MSELSEIVNSYLRAERDWAIWEHYIIGRRFGLSKTDAMISTCNRYLVVNE